MVALVKWEDGLFFSELGCIYNLTLFIRRNLFFLLLILNIERHQCQRLFSGLFLGTFPTCGIKAVRLVWHGVNKPSLPIYYCFDDRNPPDALFYFTQSVS